MEVAAIEAIVSGWNAQNVRYLIAGGLAVVAHGYMRFTSDFDVMLDFDADNLRRANEVLYGLGYRAKLPVKLEQLADAETRRVWREERHMLVFSFYQERGSMTEIDVFSYHPIPFEALHSRSVELPLASGLTVRCVALKDLMQMKSEAGRPQDLADIDQLNLIHHKPQAE